MIVLIFISPMISDVEHFFIYLLAVHISSLKKMSVQVLCPLFNRIFFFCSFLLSCMRSLYILKLSYMWFANFFPLCELPFHNIDSFVVQKLFSLMWSLLITFSFLACGFEVTSKKSLPRPLAKSFFLCFFLGV